MIWPIPLFSAMGSEMELPADIAIIDDVGPTADTAITSDARSTAVM
jgi:hypothetical protein